MRAHMRGCSASPVTAVPAACAHSAAARGRPTQNAARIGAPHEGHHMTQPQGFSQQLLGVTRTSCVHYSRPAVGVDNCAAAEATVGVVPAWLGLEGGRLLAPVQQVCGGGMAPAQAPGPGGAVLHVLEEQVVLALVEQGAVWVIHLSRGQGCASSQPGCKGRRGGGGRAWRVQGCRVSRGGGAKGGGGWGRADA